MTSPVKYLDELTEDLYRPNFLDRMKRAAAKYLTYGLVLLCLLGSGCMETNTVNTMKPPSQPPPRKYSRGPLRKNPALIDNHDGTLTDKKTGLMWQKNDNGIQYNWVEASCYCENLSLADFDDWRIPTVDELGNLDLYQEKWRLPEWPTGMKWYWTSSFGRDALTRAAYRLRIRIGGDFGVFTSFRVSGRAYVCCVRGTHKKETDE